MVEQGTENPRVGGSIPSLATTSSRYVPAVTRAKALLVLLLAACGQDQCEQLCSNTATQLGACFDEWPADWSDLDASGASQFSRFCDNQWSDVRNDLEPRELDDALDQCEETNDRLATLANDDQSCDVLRALYLE